MISWHLISNSFLRHQQINLPENLRLGHDKEIKLENMNKKKKPGAEFRDLLPIIWQRTFSMPRNAYAQILFGNENLIPVAGKSVVDLHPDRL